MPVFKRRPLQGLFPLIPLSLDSHEEVDFDGIRRSIGLVADAGLPGCIVFGSMGQMTNVSEKEFDSVCDAAIEAAHARGIAVVIGSTAAHQREAIRRARYAERSGADGSMLAAPYALPLTPDAAIGFFIDVAEALTGEMALMLYNYSPLNGLNITPEMWQRLVEIDTIKAVKESNLALPHMDQVLLLIADRVNVFSGNDPAFFHASMLGAAGATGIFSWPALKVGHAFVEACKRGEHNDPWVRRAFRALQMVSAAARRPEMPSFLSYEHGYLNALAELGGAVTGPPRRPYKAIPKWANEELKRAAQPLVDLQDSLA